MNAQAKQRRWRLTLNDGLHKVSCVAGTEVNERIQREPMALAELVVIKATNITSSIMMGRRCAA